MSELTLPELTTKAIDGTGVFDGLMKAVASQLDSQFLASRIKGPEYATVYLGSLQLAMQTAMQFVLAQHKVGLESDLLEKQIELAAVEILKGNATLAQIQQQTANLVSQKLQIEAQTELIKTQQLNEVIQGTVLTAQACKLQAEFDLTQATTLKTSQELALLAQKTATERAQTTALGVDVDSIVGRQKALYGAQTDGFKRDAEQKVATMMVNSWSVRRTTDEATVADGTNLLNDATVGRAVSKALTGVGA